MSAPLDSIAAPGKTQEVAADSKSPPPLYTTEVSAWTRLEIRQGYKRLGLVNAREGNALSEELASVELAEPYWTRFSLPEKYWRRFSEGELQASRARVAVQSEDLRAGRNLAFQVRISPQLTALWRDPVQGSSYTALDVYEGYVRMKTSKVRVTLGRFSMNYGEGLVIGNLGWHESARAFDGLHARYELPNNSFIDTFATTEAQNKEHLGVFAGGDRFFWGIYSNFGGYFAPGFELEPYFLGRTIPDATGNTLLTPGLRIKQEWHWFDYRLESDLQFGRTDLPGAALAYQTETEVGVTILPKFRVGLGGAIASAEDPDTPDRQEGFSDLFPTGHKFFGLTDVFGPRRNALSGFANLSATLSEQVTVITAGHYFHRLIAPEGAAHFAGLELDSQMTIQLGKHSSLRTLYGLFVPNDDHFRPEVSGFEWGEPAHFFECQGGIEF